MLYHYTLPPDDDAPKEDSEDFKEVSCWTYSAQNLSVHFGSPQLWDALRLNAEKLSLVGSFDAARRALPLTGRGRGSAVANALAGLKVGRLSLFGENGVGIRLWPENSLRHDPRDSIREFLGMLDERPEHAATPYVAKKHAEKAAIFLEDAIDLLIKRRFGSLQELTKQLQEAQEFHEWPVEDEQTREAAPQTWHANQTLRSKPAFNPSPGYQAAVDAGAAAKTRMFKGADMLSSDAIAEQLGVTRETVNSRRKGKELLGLTNGGRSVRYPAWQLEEAVSPHMPRLLDILKPFDAWAVYLFFTQENPLFEGVSPLDFLRIGKVDSVMDAASSYAAEMA